MGGRGRNLASLWNSLHTITKLFVRLLIEIRAGITVVRYPKTARGVNLKGHEGLGVGVGWGRRRKIQKKKRDRGEK